jgi:fatty-acyl-CoA synthase
MAPLIERKIYDTSSINAIISGGSAMSISLIRKFEKEYGIPVLHAYGMTETYPVALVARPKSYMESLPEEDLYEIKGRQGIILPCLEMRVVDEDGSETPWDGISIGELRLRGQWIAQEYYKDPERTKESIRDGWLCTGDIVTVDSEGYVQVKDRTNDLIKSGGEWISSIDLENAIMSHPAVAESAVIGIVSQRWDERPMACVVIKPELEGKVTKEDILDFLSRRVVKWWLPDEIVFVDAIPKTSVGKMAKRILRERFKEKRMD